MQECPQYFFVRFVLLVFVILQEFQGLVFAVECTTVTQRGDDLTYTCKTYQYCCNGYCCDEVYAVWYVWVLFIGLVLLCCLAAFIIRKKKARKNRITHSMFLERLRERVERQMLEEARVISNGGTVDQGDRPTINEPYVMYNSSRRAVGIGGTSTPDFPMTPIGSTPTPSHLFLARAPPPYSETPEPRSNDDNPAMRNEAPPSYDSIFS